MSIKVYSNIVYKPLGELVPYEENARENEKAIAELVKQIPISGFNVPIVIDANNVIVKGHSRLEALRRLGVDLAPCIIIEGTPDEIAAERLSDNKLSELATWDDVKLKFELREIPVSLTGLDETVVNPHAQQTEAKAKLGNVVKPSVPKDVSITDVERAEQKLVGEDRKTSFEKKQLYPITCNHCGESFMVSQEDIEKYGK